jgi:hypothetical protein
VSYTLTSFDGLTITARDADIAAGVADAPLVQLPGGRAFDPLGSGLAYRPSALFTAHALLVSDVAATRQSLMDAWQAKVGKVGTLTRTGDGGTAETVTARLLSASGHRTVNNIRTLLVPLVFQAVNLPWRGSLSGAFSTNLSISTHLYSYGQSQNGNVNQPSSIHTFTVGTGTMTSLTMTNTTTGHSFVFTGTVTTGHVLVIDTGKRSVLNNGVGAYAFLTPSSTKEDWLILQPGVNAIDLTAVFTGDIVTWVPSFYDAWG